MDGTPRLRSAFPATPQTQRRAQPQDGGSPSRQRRSLPIPDISAIKPLPASETPNDPLIPKHILDAPTQRLFAASFWIILLAWRCLDFFTLQESEEQSLWLFMKWVAIDGVFLFGLPGLKIPWLEWSSSTMTLLFCAHAVLDAMLMFRIPLPVSAGVAAVGRSLWGAYEVAVNEHSVNPDTITHNDSLILGRQIIHILPEGSAILNEGKEAFCVDGTRQEVRLPITINSTNPISMELLRIDLDTEAEETIHISKSQIKTMHKEASRLISYSDQPNQPKTLYHAVKKPGLYVLQKVVDESNLEVARKRLAHTVVVPCPKAMIVPSTPDRCRGDLSNVELEVSGTPPMRVKYRKVVGQHKHDATLENIQPEDFSSPLSRQVQSALVVPNRVDASWAKSQDVRVPLSESLGIVGTWVYSIEEVQDGFGNAVSYMSEDNDSQGRYPAKSSQLQRNIIVHDRPSVNLGGCNPQRPLKIARGHSASLPVQYIASGKAEMSESPYHLEWLFTPQSDILATGEHMHAPQKKSARMKNSHQRPQIDEAGLYTITSVSTDFCGGEVLEPASCLLQNPPQPQLSLNKEEIFDKCAGSPIGLRVDLDLIGTPPFEIHYRMTKAGGRVHSKEVELVDGLRRQIELTPQEAGHYTYDFIEISDAVYKHLPLRGISISQDVKPSASARFVNAGSGKVTCIDDAKSFDVALQGEGPFSVDYELIHGGKRAKYSLENIEKDRIEIQTERLRDGGDYTLSLTSITDGMGCKEFLKEEAKINVRHQKPKVGFGQVEGKRSVDTLDVNEVQLPLRLAGEGPWAIKYVDKAGNEHSKKALHANDMITVAEEGIYELTDLRDSLCPGVVDEAAKTFEVKWIPRPEMRITSSDNTERKDNIFIKPEVCEGDDDEVQMLFKGSAPYKAHYVQYFEPLRGTTAPKDKELRTAANTASLRMDTSQAGSYEYRFTKLGDVNYEHSPKQFTPITIQQRVNERPSAAFVNAGKTYSFCSVESDGEEVIPITLHGLPPFDLEVEIKHHGTARPETVSLTGITSRKHNIRIPHSRLHLGKSTVSLRRITDSRGCARTLDSATPRVQISVHDAPTITPMESYEDFCVGDRINFALSGTSPFQVFYTFEGSPRKAVASTATFRRLAEKPGEFVVTGVQDSASQCRSATNITKQIHGMPSVRVSRGKEGYVDIHEGGEAEILFEFGGVPPFKFTYTRSANTKPGGGNRGGRVLDMRSETSESHSMKIRATQEGTYEVVSIKDRFCAYAKPGVKVDQEPQELLQY